VRLAAWFALLWVAASSAAAAEAPSAPVEPCRFGDIARRDPILQRMLAAIGEGRWRDADQAAVEAQAVCPRDPQELTWFAIWRADIERRSGDAAGAISNLEALAPVHGDLDLRFWWSEAYLAAARATGDTARFVRARDALTALETSRLTSNLRFVRRERFETTDAVVEVLIQSAPDQGGAPRLFEFRATPKAAAMPVVFRVNLDGIPDSARHTRFFSPITPLPPREVQGDLVACTRHVRIAPKVAGEGDPYPALKAQAIELFKDSALFQPEPGAYRCPEGPALFAAIWSDRSETKVRTPPDLPTP
jgi:hypothetical protein